MEGAVLATLQWLALRHTFPRLHARAWIGATVAVAASGWLVGMSIPILMTSPGDARAPVAEPPLALILLGATLFGGLAGRPSAPHRGWSCVVTRLALASGSGPTPSVGHLACRGATSAAAWPTSMARAQANGNRERDALRGPARKSVVPDRWVRRGGIGVIPSAALRFSGCGGTATVWFDLADPVPLAGAWILADLDLRQGHWGRTVAALRYFAVSSEVDGVDQSSWDVGVGARYAYPVSSLLSVYGEGLVQHVSYSADVGGASLEMSGTGFAVGGGVLYGLSPKLALGGGINYSTADLEPEMGDSVSSGWVSLNAFAMYHL